MQVGGLHIRVDRAGQSAHGSAGGSVMYERNRTVFVGNLPFDVEVRLCHHVRVIILFLHRNSLDECCWGREGKRVLAGGGRGAECKGIGQRCSGLNPPVWSARAVSVLCANI